MEIRAKITQPTLKAQINAPAIRAKLNGGNGSLSLSGLQILLASLPEYYDDAAAIADGMSAGQYYRAAAVNLYGYKRGHLIQIEV